MAFTTPPPDWDTWHVLVSGLMKSPDITPAEIDDWASRGPGYVPGEILSPKSGLRWRDRIGPGTFIHWARQQGWDGGITVVKGRAAPVQRVEAVLPENEKPGPLRALYQPEISLGQVMRVPVWFISVDKRKGFTGWSGRYRRTVCWRQTINDGAADGNDGVLLARSGGEYKQPGVERVLRVERHRPYEEMERTAERIRAGAKSEEHRRARASLAFSGSGMCPFPAPLAALDCDYKPGEDNEAGDGRKGRDAALKACIGAGMGCYASTSGNGFHAVCSLEYRSMLTLPGYPKRKDELHGIRTGLPGLSWDLFLPGCRFHTAINLDRHLGGPGLEEALPELTRERLIALTAR